MTVNTTTRSIPYNGTDSPEDTFDVPFPVLNADHLVVTKTAAGPTVTNPDFTVTGEGTEDVELTLTDTTIVTGETLTIERTVPLLQASAFADGATYPLTIERAFDYLMMVCQQQQDTIDDLTARIEALEA